MTTHIKFINSFGKEISPDQALASDFYRKITVENTAVMKVELVLSQHRIGSVHYFLSLEDDKQVILNSHFDRYPEKTFCSLFFNKISSGSFNQWDREDYKSKIGLKYKGIDVYDENHQLICDCQFDLLTGKLKAGGKKQFYGDSNDDEPDDRLVFFYNEEGDIDHVIDMNGNYGYNDSISLEELLEDERLSQELFPWDQHIYFHHLTPYLPIGRV
ncbi:MULTISPECIES: hypothetical protein [Desertivirga]|uniref:hypothetical protein n=1 Tax=Desertivirga TaxID=3153690 RepID=UPI001A974410|nr:MULTISPECIES: hypothetical protein [unclassified Pedobacter]